MIWVPPCLGTLLHFGQIESGANLATVSNGTVHLSDSLVDAHHFYSIDLQNSSDDDHHTMIWVPRATAHSYVLTLLCLDTLRS